MNSRRRFMGDQLRAKTYEILEYIQSTGTQHIDTGLKGSDIGKFETKFKLNAVSSNYVGVFGTVDGSDAFYTNANSTNRLRFHINGTNYLFSDNLSVHTAVYDEINHKLTQDDTETTVSTVLNFSTNLYICGGLYVNSSTIQHSDSNHYYYKFYTKQGTLIRDMVPVKRLKDNVIGMYDRVGKQFYANAGTGSFVGVSKTIPEYILEPVTRLQYIQATGTQYIDLGSQSIDNDKDLFDIRFQYVDTSAGHLYFGARADRNYPFDLYAQGGSFIFRCMGGTRSIGNPPVDTDIHTLILDFSNRILKYDDADGTIGGTVNSFTGTVNIFRNTNDTDYCKARLYSFKYAKSGVAVFDLVPVKYGDEVCMLDRISRMLYHNAGTGEFIGA